MAFSFLASPRRQTPATTLDTFVRDVNDTPLLGALEERDLAERIADGDQEARDHLIRANLRLVIRFAKQYANRGFSLEDLIQQGTLGLIRAVEGFDPERGLRFSTYAKFWIVQSIQQIIRGGHTVRIPSYAAELLAKWRRTADEIAQETGQPPVEAEIAARLGVTNQQLKIIKRALRIYQGMGAVQASEEQPLLDVVDDGPGPHFAMSKSEDVDQVLRLVNTLQPREAAVLKMRYGLDGHEPMNLQEIGARLQLTRERVRQLEQKALRSLREAV